MLLILHCNTLNKCLKNHNIEQRNYGEWQKHSLISRNQKKKKNYTAGLLLLIYFIQTLQFEENNKIWVYFIQIT